MPSSSDTHRITQFNIVFHEPEVDCDEQESFPSATAAQQ